MWDISHFSQFSFKKCCIPSVRILAHFWHIWLHTIWLSLYLLNKILHFTYAMQQAFEIFIVIVLIIITWNWPLFVTQTFVGFISSICINIDHFCRRKSLNTIQVVHTLALEFCINCDEREEDRLVKLWRGLVWRGLAWQDEGENVQANRSTLC